MIYTTKRFSSHREYDLREALKTRPDLDLSKFTDKEIRKDVEDGLIRQTRSENPGVTQKRGIKKNKPTGTKPVSWENRGGWKPTPEIRKKAEELKLSKKAKKIKRGGMITAGTLGAAGLIYGGKKLYDKIKIDKELQKYEKQLGITRKQFSYQGKASGAFLGDKIEKKIIDLRHSHSYSKDKLIKLLEDEKKRII